jgi:hypothetical protein
MDPNTSAWDVMLHYWPAALFVPSILGLIGILALITHFLDRDSN